MPFGDFGDWHLGEQPSFKAHARPAAFEPEVVSLEYVELVSTQLCQTARCAAAGEASLESHGTREQWISAAWAIPLNAVG
jgi:hypothetical protein